MWTELEMQLSLKSSVLVQAGLDLGQRLMISASCRKGSSEGPSHFEESWLYRSQ